MTEDTLAWPLLTSLAAAMTVEIEDSGLSPFCFVGILPGGMVSMEYCDECSGRCGSAWVRLASIREEPPEFGNGYSSCHSVFVVNVEMGMIRCHQIMNEDGTPMSVEYQNDKAQAQMAEQAAMRRVLLCSDLTVGQLDPNRLLGAYTPIGPQGGCVGGAWTAQFEMF